MNLRTVLLLGALCAPGFSARLQADEAPGRVLDLTNWKLTLPAEVRRGGVAQEIKQPTLEAYIDPDFFFEKQRAVVFRAPCGGAVTRGSRYPRCELREMAAKGQEAAWGTEDGKAHELTVRLAVTATPAVKKEVVCAQIHDREDDVLMIRLEGTKLLIERNREPKIVLEEKYVLGTPFDLKITAGGGKIEVWHNGQKALDWAVVRAGCYFKAGCYTQSNPERGDKPEAFGEVVIYALKLEHRG